MKKIFSRHKFYWSQKTFLTSALVGLVFLAVSVVANYYANIYAIEKSSSSVTDILLNILPVVDTSIIFVEGSFLFIGFVILLLIKEPKAIPFVIKSSALFVIVRSFFVILTHYGPFPDHAIMDDYNLISSFTSSADLFFSGHTGMPYLFALIFWRQKTLRWIFLGSSIVAGASVLLAHYHYSIDVASAFFITFGIYHIARRLFKKDYELLLSEFEAVDN
jgi:hypothetical protein